MPLIRGVPAGPNGSGGSFANEVEADRAALWDALGASQGVIRGFVHSGVAGAMALDFTAGSGVLGERAADGTASLPRGYHVWADVTTRVPFDPASASARNDAVVLAFVDTEDGPLGTGVTEAGPQIVVVKGVSGTTTARTDADINGWLGRGGWTRLMDVPIAAGSTEINLATIVKTTASYQRPSRGHHRRTTDQGFGNATLADVTNMGVDLTPGTYILDVEIVTKADAAAGIKFGWTLPSSTAYTFTAIGPHNAMPAGTATSYNTEWVARTGTGTSTVTIPLGSIDGNNIHLRLRLEAVVTAAGRVQLQAAQQRDEGGASYVLAGSSMEWRRVA
jgi:hypothetical protein